MTSYDFLEITLHHATGLGITAKRGTRRQSHVRAITSMQRHKHNRDGLQWQLAGPRAHQHSQQEIIVMQCHPIV